MPPTILITAAAGYWGTRLAAALAAQPGDLRLLGVDRKPLPQEIPGLDFIRGDIRNPLIQDFLAAERVQTVVHLDFVEHPRHEQKAYTHNVLAAKKFFAMCAAAGVRKLILKSSTAVYGAHPTNPLFLTEDHPLNGSRMYAHNQHLAEIESFANGFARQHPALSLTILRFAHIVGPTADTPLTRFLTDARAPSLLGFNPLVQIIHEDDVIAALAHAATHHHPGAFNIAADPPLPLNKLMALAGKLPLPVPHPLAYAAASGPRAQHLPIEPDYLRYPCVAALEKMRTQLHFTPQHTAEETLRQFAEATRHMPYVPDPLARAYQKSPLKDILERRLRKEDHDPDFDFHDDDFDLDAQELTDDE